MEEVLMNELDKTATKGEFEFVDIINDLAEEKPDHFKLYYEPNGKNCYPDFALYSKTDGLIFFEIKDHSIDNIKKFSHNEVEYTYAMSGESSLPLDKKLIYQFKKEFDDSRIDIPIAELFVFPNLSEKEVQNTFRFDTSKTNRYLFKEDLFYILHFKKKLRENRIFRYVETEESRTAAILSISRRLSPSVISKKEDLSIQPMLFENFHNRNVEDPLLILNNNQEVTYRNFINKRGYRFLKGHAGTGKTILLLMRAKQLASKHKDIKIFFTYFTSQLDDLFLHLKEEYPNIYAKRFTQFCMDNIKKAYDIGKDKQKWEQYYQECLEIIENDSHQLKGNFDYILIDEGQDFTPTQGKIIDRLAKGSNFKNKQVLIAFDDFQALHQKGIVDTPLTFKGKQRGRVTILRSSFRTPKEIADRAKKLIKEEIFSVRPVENSFNHIRLKPSEDPIDYINRTVPLILGKKDIELQDIAIIYPNYRYVWQKMDDLLKKLEPPHIFYKTSYKNNSKEKKPKKIKVLSSNYSKGLEFKVVFLVHFDEVPNKHEIQGNYKAEEHLYVAMTRTTHYLIILTQKNNDLIDLITSEDKEEDIDITNKEHV